MTRNELIARINRMNSLKIPNRLIIDKINNPTNGVSFYKDMDPYFLDEMQFITGTANGFVLTEHYIKFIVKARQRHSWEPVMAFTLNFVRDESQKYLFGKCLSISDIVFRADVEHPGEIITEALPSEERKAIEQLKWSIEGFVNRAEHLGYLAQA